MTPILQKLEITPTRPGVYMMRDAGGRIIYIGKAKNLKSRLSSYFKSGSHDMKVTAMLAKVVEFDYFITATENDALALESNLIKRHSPHYNVLLKDSKSFPYIKIVEPTGGYPYLEVTRKTAQGRGKKETFFGPYFNGIWARDLLEVVRDIFPLRSCSDIEFRKKTPCVNSQIGRCMGLCVGKIERDDYMKIIDDVKSFLKGSSDFGAKETLTQKMEQAASLEQFELAIRYRNGLAFLDKLKERTITEVARSLNVDIFGFAVRADVFVTSVLTVRAGRLIGIQNFSEVNKGIESEEEALSSFIMQYYAHNIVPDEIIASIPLDEVAEALGCNIFSPKVALKKKLLDMAKQNAEEYLGTSLEKIKYKQEFTVGACEELGKVLGMEQTPRKMECYDISHTGGEEVVASMVVFIDGVANKKLYRRFKIKHGQGNDDYLSMHEVIKRRLLRLGGADDSFGGAPCLIVIDGGKGQLSAALAAAKEVQGTYKAQENPQYIGDIKFISLAEENEEIFIPEVSEPIILSKRSYALRLLQRLRDEAHRFANEFHKERRAKKIKVVNK